MNLFDGKTMLVTGGTGSFGKHFVDRVLDTNIKKVIIFSRDELKQYEMQQEYPDEPRLHFMLGDVRDLERLYSAFHNVDFVLHAAAMKHVPASEYNPYEAVKTNILGSQNVVTAALAKGVKKVVALSTDKASSPVNLYGATKLVSDKLFVAANLESGPERSRFSVIRYGNFVGSRGSVIPLFRKLSEKGVVPITDERTTRFWITLDHGIEFAMKSFNIMKGGEIFVPKIPSMKIVDLARAVCPKAELKKISIRPGEKLHEEMISRDDARHTLDMGAYFVICPEMNIWKEDDYPKGQAVEETFCYSSEINNDWLSIEQLKEMIKEL
jgi:UDP-N-acetylglucosamine 4,6-dehydratase